MAKTDWTGTDTVKPADMNEIGQEINQLREDVDNIHIPPATLTEAGIVQLSNATDGTRENVAATEKAVKAAVADSKKYVDDNFFNRNTFARPNLLKNSSGYMGLTYWRNYGPGTWSTFRAADTGSQFFINDAIAANSYAILESDAVNVSPGSKMIIAADFNTWGTTTGTVSIEVVKKINGNGTAPIIGSVVADLNKSWHRKSNTFTVPNDVESVTVRLVVTKAPVGWKSFARIKLSYTYDNDPAGVNLPYSNEADTAALFQYASDRLASIEESRRWGAL